MPVCGIAYRDTRREDLITPTGGVHNILFVPAQADRPTLITSRVDRDGIGARESTLFWTQRRFSILVRHVLVVDDGSGLATVDDFERFFYAAADGQIVTYDPSALPHFNETHDVSLESRSVQISVPNRRAGSVRFELIANRTR
jgi:hypothetical protein